MKLDLIVLRSSDMERLASFYEAIGIGFEKHSHGNGPAHMGGEIEELIFEIYPKRNEDDDTTNLRIGFQVESIEQTLKKIEEFEYKMITRPKESPWGLRAVIDDLEGHRIELTEKSENQALVMNFFCRLYRSMCRPHRDERVAWVREKIPLDFGFCKRTFELKLPRFASLSMVSTA
jgi:lactoylglutathione lyase